MFLVRLLLASIVMTVCFATSASGAPDQLPPDEVQALRDIFNTLGKRDWDFSNPCTTPASPNKSFREENKIAAVDCSNCFVNGINESYRVVGIFLRRQDLRGTLPDLVKLHCLQELDLTGNYLNGSIPLAWGSMQQLVTMTVEFNQLNGSLPPELGNMPSIEEL